MDVFVSNPVVKSFVAGSFSGIYSNVSNFSSTPQSFSAPGINFPAHRNIYYIQSMNQVDEFHNFIKYACEILVQNYFSAYNNIIYLIRRCEIYTPWSRLVLKKLIVLQKGLFNIYPHSIVDGDFCLPNEIDS